MNVEFFHFDHYYQQIIMGLSDAASIPFEKPMSSSLHLGVFKGGTCKWTLFTSFVYTFFSDLEDPPATNPPKIILISPMASCPQSLVLYLSYPSMVAHMAPFFVQTFIIYPNGSWFLLGPSNVCILQCDVRGPSATYSTCFCLLLLLERKWV